jgi:Rrf2 family cysteine metabolism transcriptional repressor
MKISTKARYGIRALLDLSLHGNGDLVPLKDIAQRQQISMTYLEHLVAPLISAGIIRSVRGSKGGIVLARSPAQIRLSDIIRILEGSTAPVECVDNPQACQRSDGCVTRDIWSEMKNAVDGVLESITLENLAERQKAKEQSVNMYYI